MRRRTIVATLTTAFALVAPVAPVAPASAGDGWHPVHEQWQPYVESGLELPAGRYCGDFTVDTTPVFQDIRYRVLSRWDSGGPRETAYAGPLVTEATNEATGDSVRLNMSGSGTTLQREDGSLATYDTRGPVGFGWPTGSVGLDQGFYVFRGRHVVEFPESGPRRLVVDQGPETDVCAMLS